MSQFANQDGSFTKNTSPSIERIEIRGGQREQDGKKLRTRKYGWPSQSWLWLRKAGLFGRGKSTFKIGEYK